MDSMKRRSFFSLLGSAVAPAIAADVAIPERTETVKSGYLRINQKSRELEWSDDSVVWQPLKKDQYRR